MFNSSAAPKAAYEGALSRGIRLNENNALLLSYRMGLYTNSLLCLSPVSLVFVKVGFFIDSRAFTQTHTYADKQNNKQTSTHRLPRHRQYQRRHLSAICIQ